MDELDQPEAQTTPLECELSRDESNPARSAGGERRQLEAERQRLRLIEELCGPATPRRTRLGNYQILDELGSGGMGVVYAGYDARLDRKVALKTVSDQAEPALQRLLESEARAMARLRHANVATVYEIGVFEGQTFIAMEYVEGQTLRQWWVRETPSRAQLLRVFANAGEGLVAAHEAGLVHRDFKPSNVMINHEGEVKVLDFGLARPDPGHEETLRWSPSEAPPSLGKWRAGTPAYMAPEQFRGRWADTASDQFSFCVSLYEALYGERPFAGESREQRWAAAERGEIRPARRDVDVPASLRQLLVRGLAPQPNRRFASMRALLDELEAQIQRELDGPLAGLSATSSLMLDGRAPTTPAPARAEPSGGTSEWSFRLALVVAAAALLAALLVVGAKLREPTEAPGNGLDEAPEADLAPPSPRADENEERVEMVDLSSREHSDPPVEEPASAPPESSIPTKTRTSKARRPREQEAASKASVKLSAGKVSEHYGFIYSRIDGGAVLTLASSATVPLARGDHRLEISEDRVSWRELCEFEIGDQAAYHVLLSRGGCKTSTREEEN